jgi:hypothetical protein
MIETKKSHQHHVWQEYLRAWSVEGAVYCLQNNRVFQTGTPVLGMKTDFYKLHPLEQQDLDLLLFLLDLDKAHPIARQHHEMVLTNILGPTLFVRQNRDKIRNMAEVDAHLDVYNTNTVDNQHTIIESFFVPLLARSLDGDFSWYEDDADCIVFCNFVAAQHMRTRAVKERTIERLNTRLGLDVSRIWDIIALINAFTLGCNLFLERKKRRLIVIRNDTSVPFITADQPVTNLLATGESAPEKLSLYYPISPRLALHLGEPDEPIEVPLETMTAPAAAFLNRRIAGASLTQVYAQTADPLILVRDCLRHEAMSR